MLESACTARAPSNPTTPSSAPSSAPSKCGVDTTAVNGTCVGILPYNWTRTEGMGTSSDARPIQVHRDRHNVAECLHACEMENGADPHRNLVKRCDRVTFNQSTSTCMLFDSESDRFKTESAPDTTLYSRG